MFVDICMISRTLHPPKLWRQMERHRERQKEREREREGERQRQRERGREREREREGESWRYWTPSNVTSVLSITGN